MTRNCPSGWLRKQHVAPFVLFFLKHHTFDKIRWFQESSFRKNGMHTCSRLMKCLSILEFGMRDKIRRPAPSGKLRNSNCEHQILPISYALEFEHRVDAFSQFLWRHAERDREREGGAGRGTLQSFQTVFFVSVLVHTDGRGAHGRLHTCTAARRVFTFRFCFRTAGLAEPRREKKRAS